LDGIISGNSQPAELRHIVTSSIVSLFTTFQIFIMAQILDMDILGVSGTLGISGSVIGCQTFIVIVLSSVTREEYEAPEYAY
jgi:hypothetical protein